MVHLDTHLSFGRYHWRMCLLLMYSQTSSLGPMYFMTYGGLKPNVRCNNASSAEGYVDYYNMNDACDQIAAGDCANYTLWSDEFYSIAAEWDLVCDRLSLVYLPTTYQMLGVLVGAPFFGQMSDWIGRRRTLLLAWTLVAVTDIASSWVPEWYSFTVSRVIIGFVVAGQICCVYVLTAEFLAKADRFTVLMLLGWAPCFLPMALLAYLAHTWRRFLLFQGVYCIPGILYVLFFIDESPRWLVAKNHFDRAFVLIKKIRHTNGKRTDDEKLQAEFDNYKANKEAEGKPKKYAFYHLWYSWKLVSYTVCLGSAWFLASAVSYSIGFNAGNLASNIHINFLLVHLPGWAAELATLGATLYFHGLGRRHVLIGQIAILGAGYVVLTVLNLTMDTRGAQLQTVATVLYVALSFVVAPLWMIVYMLSAELFPTPIRNIAGGAMSSCARVGGALAPQIVFIGETNPQIATMIMAVIACVSAVLCALWLDETKGHSLPDEMPSKEQRIDNWFRQKLGRRRVTPAAQTNTQTTC